jgi:hypothetical protein
MDDDRVFKALADPTRRLLPVPAALPQPGADPADSRPVDRQVHRAVTVVHDQLEKSPKTAGSIDGWTYILSGLKALVETGQPMAS